MKSKYFTKPTIYVSHPIRGTNNDVKGNCKRANAAAARLRRVFPEVDFYVPSEHDLALQILWNEKMVTVEDIMYADLEILRNCDGWMYYHFDDSRGCEEEWALAERLGLTVSKVDWINFDIERASYGYLREKLTDLVEDVKERFRRQ